MTEAVQEVAGTKAEALAPALKLETVSILVPVFNEQGNPTILASEVDGVATKLGLDWELVFVDDGSTDGTAAEVRAAIEKNPRVKLVRLAKNSGLSSAIEAGIHNSRGSVLVIMDGDLQADPEDLPTLLAGLEKADVVCGYRANRRAGDGPIKTWSSRIANAVRTAMIGDTVSDAGCTFRAFRRSAVARIKWFRGMHRFFPTLVRLEGHTVVEVPVKNRPRRFGVSKYGVWNRVFAATYDLFAVRWMRSRVVPWRVLEEPSSSKKA